MPELLKLLEKLYEGNFKCTEEDMTSYFDEDDQFVSDVVSECNDLLIVQDGVMAGTPHWKNIRVLQDNDYLVYAGEKDSFGWLTGCVQKRGDKRILVFG